MSIFDFLFRGRKKKEEKQTSFVYCPGILGDETECRFELSAGGVLVEENPIDHFVRYVCKECLHESFWDFDHFPLPVLLRDFKRPNPVVNEDHLDYRFICYCSQCRKMQLGIYPEPVRVRLGHPAPMCRDCKRENERHDFSRRLVEAAEHLADVQRNLDAMSEGEEE